MRWLPIVGILVSGCGAQIGDACQSNVDCSPLGDRFCDTSTINGYCTQEGCDDTLDPCPSEAVCIRFFTTRTDEPCTFDGAIDRSDCPNVTDFCVCDISVGGQCMSNAGHCAPSSTERRWCQRSCSSNGDCRDGYECRETGTHGSEAIPTFDMANGAAAKFCAPAPQAF